MGVRLRRYGKGVRQAVELRGSGFRVSWGWGLGSFDAYALLSVVPRYVSEGKIGLRGLAPLGY